MNEEYNGVVFKREDVEDGQDLVIALPANDIVDAYSSHFELGYVGTSLVLCADGTMLINLRKMEEEV